MAVTQSKFVDNILAQGSARTDSTAAKDAASEYGNKLRRVIGTLEIADGDFDADDDVVVLCALPIDAVLHAAYFAFDELDAGTDSLVNLGLYTDAAGTDAQDEDCYATVVTTFRSATTATDFPSGAPNLAFEARGIQLAGQKVWEDAGYSDRDAALAEADQGQLYLALTQTATVSDDSGGGTLTFLVEYSADH